MAPSRTRSGRLTRLSLGCAHARQRRSALGARRSPAGRLGITMGAYIRRAGRLTMAGGGSLMSRDTVFEVAEGDGDQDVYEDGGRDVRALRA